MKRTTKTAYLPTICLSLIAMHSISFMAMSAQQTKDLSELSNSVKVSSVTPLENHLTFVNDPIAKASLREILGQFKQLQANFSQQISDLQGAVLQESNGQIFLQKPQKLRWSVSSPEESLLIADGKTVFNIDPFVEQITLIEQAELTANNPLMLLVSDQESQWQSVNIQKNEQGFLLRPSDINAPITEVVLTFDSQQNLSSLTSIDRQQQKNIIVFTEVSIDKPISDEQFTFETPEGWVIDDQRALD